MNSKIKKPPDYYKNKNEQQIKTQNLIIDHLQQNILKYGNHFAIPTNLKFKEIDTNSWFSIREANNKNFNKLPFGATLNYDFENTNLSPNVEKNIDDIDYDKFSTKPLKLYLTKHQTKVINRWIDCYTIMYNKTICLMRKLYFNNEKILGISNLKKILYGTKMNIINSSGVNTYINGKHKIVYMPSHELDCAINDALIAMRSAMTNLKRSNIKKFRLRYIKMSKRDRIMKIEKQSFKGESFCMSALGKKVKCNMDNYNYEEEAETTAIIKRKNGEYVLYWKETKDFSNYNKPKSESVIGIDLGIRVVGTCYANEKVIEIVNNVDKKIGKRLDTIDKIYETKFTDKKKRKIVGKKYSKLKNMSMDMRWKIGKYLTDNFNTIVVGNFSTKEMGEKGNVSKKTKRIGGILSLYKLKKVIQYYCSRKGQVYKEANEMCTTQCCGRCGNRKRDIGSAKEYKCEVCKLKVKRDVNSSRLMVITSLT